MDEEYKSNSHKQDEKPNAVPNRRLEKVINGAAKIQSKNAIQKFTGALLSDDAQSIGSYLVMDVLVPLVKDAIEDTIHMLLRGDTGRRSSPSARVSYRSYYDKPNGYREARSSLRQNDFDYDNLKFDTRGEAEMVLTAMEEALDRYQIVSVADLYDLANVSSDNYMLGNYGWTSLVNADVIRIRDGYVIKLPRALPIK